MPEVLSRCQPQGTLQRAGRSPDRRNAAPLPVPRAPRTEIATPATTAWQALHELEARAVPAVRWLMGLRLLPARLLGRLPRTPSAAHQRVLAALLSSRFVRLDERPGRELVVGPAGRFWRLAGDRGAVSWALGSAWT